MNAPEVAPPAPPARVFISYSRRNRPFARRLWADLLRAGLDPWLDDHSIPFDSPDWNATIGEAIRNADRFLLLASPEAAESPNVAPEVLAAEAAGRPITVLAVAGEVAELSRRWPRRQITAVPVGEYRTVLPRLLHQLGAPVASLSSFDSLLDGPPRTAAAATAELGVGPPPPGEPPGFAWLPLWPSGYGMAWLVGPADAPLCRPDPVAVLFQHTGPRAGRTGQVIRAWAAEAAKVSATPWMVVTEGPLDETEQRYVLDTRTHLHQLRDTIDAGGRALDQFATGRRVALYFNTLVPLAFEIGSLTRNMHTRRRVYHFAHHTTGDGYDLVHAGW